MTMTTVMKFTIPKKILTTEYAGNLIKLHKIAGEAFKKIG